MLILIWSLTGLALLLCVRSKKALARQNRTASFGFLFCSKLIEPLSVFLLVGALFIMIALWARALDAPSSTLQALWRGELALSKLKCIVDKSRISSRVAVCLLIASLLFDRMVQHTSFSGKISRIYAWLSEYRKQHNRITILTIALLSFTIFSGTVPASSARIEARIKVTEESYNAYLRDSYNLATIATAEEKTKEIIQSLPPSWYAVRKQEDRNLASFQELNEILERIRKRYGVAQSEGQPSKEVSSGDVKVEESPPAVHHVNFDAWHADEEIKANVAVEAEASVSQDIIRELRDRLDHLRKHLIEETASLLSTPLGVKLPEAVVGQLLSHKNFEELRYQCDQYPLLGAIVEVLEKSLSQLAGNHIKRIADQIASSLLEKPSTRPEDIDKREGPLAAADWTVAQASIAWAGKRATIESGNVARGLARSRVVEAHIIETLERENKENERYLLAEWDRQTQKSNEREGTCVTYRWSLITGRSKPVETGDCKNDNEVRSALNATSKEAWDLRRNSLNQVATIILSSISHEDKRAQLKALTSPTFVLAICMKDMPVCVTPPVEIETQPWSIQERRIRDDIEAKYQAEIDALRERQIKLYAQSHGSPYLSANLLSKSALSTEATSVTEIAIAGAKILGEIR